ncbi:MAG: PAS domain-containing protein [Candidatus Riflebacteria bacterium]|nr:PAS domain-containing protein [Candidatus Riflebacteria bacterium]
MIAERKQTETATEHQQVFLTILDSLDAMVYVADMKTYEILFVNQCVKDVFGDITGKICWQALQSGQTKPCEFCTNNKIVDSEGNPTVIYRWEFENTKMKLWYYICDRAIKWSDGRIVRLEIATDITERKRVERELRESESRLKEAQSLAHLGHWDLDLRGNRLSWSDEVYRIFGLAPQEFGATYEAFLEKVYPDDRDFVNKAYSDSVKDKSSYDIEHRVKLKNGDVKYVNERCCTQYDESGNPLRSIGTVLDITGRKQYEEQIQALNAGLARGIAERTAELEKKRQELNETQHALINIVEDLNQKTAELEAANAKLQELDRLKSMFIASTSHELRTPLNSIIGFSSIILEEWLGPLNDQQKENLTTVLKSGKHLLSLINDVIDVSKIEARKHEIILEDFDLYNVMSEALDLVKHDIEKKGLDLQTELIHMPMHSERLRVIQCVVNLLSNAIKFTEKGTVRVSTRNIPASNSGFQRRDCIEISVSDTGIGIPDESISKLFLPFVRIPSPLTLKVKGTGLGLYLVKKIVTEILSGEITASSIDGEGSSFILKIPVKL